MPLRCVHASHCGITVVALEQAVAAPFATRQLADLGARVIKIERPGVGDFARDYDQSVQGLSAYFVWLNRSKESLTLDVKHADAPRDPGAADRATPTCSFRTSRPARRRGSDSTRRPCGATSAPDRVRHLGLRRQRPVRAQESLRSSGAERSRRPVRHRHAGRRRPRSASRSPTSRRACTRIPGSWPRSTSARRPGEGTRIEVTMFERMAEWMSHPLYYTHFGGARRSAAGRTTPRSFRMAAFKRRRRQVRDAGHSERARVGGVLQPRSRAARTGDDARYDNNTKRTRARAEVLYELIEASSPMTAEQVVEGSMPREIANARMNAMHDVWDHPQLKARNRWREVGSPAGPLPALLPPAMPELEAPRLDPVPALGAAYRRRPRRAGLRRRRHRATACGKRRIDYIKAI